MPSIAYYLDKTQPGRSYDDSELARLQLVFSRACSELGYTDGAPHREKVAIVVFDTAQGADDPDELLSRVLAIIRNSS